MNEDKVRADFEAYIKAEWSYIPVTQVMNDGSEEYVGADSDRYEAYRAAYAQARREALEEAAKVPRQYAEQLDKIGWGNRFPDELTAIFNASTNMAGNIRALIKD